VSSKDSLAGVALKYGITIAELRKANHLWASDSIHFRKILYIPLDDTSHPNRVKPLIDLEEPTASSDPYHDKSHTSTIRRIPASQLSFFPPPAKPSARSAENSDDPSFMRPGSGYGSGSGSASPTQHSRALSSILTAFPFAASTRGTIVTRLSFDSERTSMSDDQEHELDEVRTSPLTARPWLRSSSEIAHRTSTSSTRSKRSISPATPVDHRKSWAHTDATEQHAAIRTVQLEPSPAMKLPSLTIKPKSQPRTPAGRGVDELGPRR